VSGAFAGAAPRGGVSRSSTEVAPRGSATKAVLRDTTRLLFPVYAPAPVAFSHGEGARLWDLDGREYLDFLGGIAVSSLGHAHPALVAAIREQAGRYLHVSNLYLIPEQVEAARLLAEASGLDRVFFCNSGSEAVEAALKLARRYGRRTAGASADVGGETGGGDDARGGEQARFEVLSAVNGFHGRTMGALAATGVERYRRPFEPLPVGFVHVPYGDLDAARDAAGERTCAILVEPIQGEAGVIPAPPGYLEGLERLARERNLLLIVDEIQTGIGRTGHMFAFQAARIRPDIVTVAKGLGGGVPVGAVLAREEVAAALQPGDHGSTFGGNPLACAASAAVLRTIAREDLLANARGAGDALGAGLERLGREGAPVREVRGAGLLLGVEIDCDARAVARACLERGLLVNAPRPTTLRLAPPLVVTPEEVDRGLSILGDVLKASGPETTITRA
jgi:acetylornithine/N-succinyldiaminopimelate aminotransferase